MLKLLNIKILKLSVYTNLCKEIAQERLENKALKRQLIAMQGDTPTRDPKTGRFIKREAALQIGWEV